MSVGVVCCLRQRAGPCPEVFNVESIRHKLVTPDFMRVSSSQLTRQWPNVPLFYLVGDWEAPVACCYRDSDAPMMAPLRADMTEPEAAAEAEREFHWVCDRLVKAKMPVV